MFIPFMMPKAQLALSVAVAIFSLIAVADASPKVFGLDFKRETTRDPAYTGRIQRRQKSVSVDITNEENFYLVNITIGSNNQPFVLQLDTGSSDIWVPSITSDVCRVRDCSVSGQFDASSSSSFINIAQNLFQISYVDGSGVTGDYFADTLNIGRVTLRNQTMALATNASRSVGIAGIGFAAGESIANTDPNAIYPNIINVLKDQGYINTLAYSLWLNDLESNTGSILFGGVDTDRYRGSLITLPIQPDARTGTISTFTVALSSVSIADGSGNSQFSRTNLAIPVILDSGTSLTYLPDDIANSILDGVGAVYSSTLGGYVVPCTLANSPATFSFGFGGSNGPTINVELNQFVTPIVLRNGGSPTFDDGSAACNFGIQPAGSDPNLFGDTFLRSAYVVYDLENGQIGIAQTIFNATSSNVREISGNSLPGASAAAASGLTVSQTFTGIPLQTQAATISATGGVPQVTGGKSGLFNLAGSRTATAAGPTGSASSRPSGGRSSGAISDLKASSVERTTAIFGLLMMTLFVFYI